ncbi:helix-turn-helix, fis-type [Sulfitobacter geojensis]|nr:helix-turn-helix, fis-type [Sulfitobacter geojensis]NYI30237.1 transposase-like protein [Sulfitobacter geojensis]
MRYAASEELEIIRLVEEGHRSARQTLAKLGIPRTTFYRWYDRYLQRGEAGLQDHRINRPNQSMFGTAFPMRFGARWLNSR